MVDNDVPMKASNELITSFASIDIEGRAPAVFAGTSLGLRLSDDGGISWSSVQRDWPVFALHVSAGGSQSGEPTLLAGTAKGGMASDDAGNSFRAILSGSAVLALASGVAGRAERDRMKQESRVIVAGTSDSGVFRSIDDGRSWKAVNTGLLDLNILGICMSPQFDHDRTAFVATDTQLCRSRNGARAWRSLEFPVVEAHFQCLSVSPAFAEDGLVMVGTEEHGLYRSGDQGDSWEQVGDPGSGSINSIAFSGSGDLAAAAWEDRVGFLTDHGTSWHAGPSMPDQVLSLGFARWRQGELLLAGLVDGAIFVTADQGESWTHAAMA